MNIDLGPTFIALAGGEVPPYMDGQPLVPVWDGGKFGTRGSLRSHVLVEHYGEHKVHTPPCDQYNNQGLAVSSISFFSQSLEFDITTKTQFHTHLITAGVLVDTKRGGRQNNQGYRWRWIPGWQQEI